MVMPLVTSSEFASGTLTEAFVPLNDKALPNFPAPAPAQVAFVIVPLLPEPDWSTTPDPLPASNPYAATRPVDPAVTVALISADGVLRFPAASSAVTL